LGWFSAFFCTSTSPQEHSNLVFSGIVARPLTVGYAQNGLRSGATMITPQFVPVDGTSKIALEDLTVTGDDIDTDGNISIQTLDANGMTVDSYMYLDWGDPKGWCDDSYTVVEDVTFDVGQGLFTTGTGTGAAIQYAGKVGKDDVIVQLRAGATSSGNPFPVAIALQDILPEGDDIDTDGNISIQVLDANGMTVDSYMYLDWGDPKGWCDDSYTVVEGVTFPAGQGLFITGTKATEYLRFPAPEL